MVKNMDKINVFFLLNVTRSQLALLEYANQPLNVNYLQIQSLLEIYLQFYRCRMSRSPPTAKHIGEDKEADADKQKPVSSGYSL